MSGLALAYCLFPDEAAAGSAARTLLAERLIACANILAPCTSIYEWQGQTQQNAETPVLFKTTVERADALVTRLEAIHPYDVPAILCWPVERAPEAFARWVMDGTGG